MFRPSKISFALLPLLVPLLLLGSETAWAIPLFEAPYLSYDMGSTFAPGFAVADVNGDGRPDLVAATGGTFNGFTVRLGNGDGTFGPRIDHDLQDGFSQSLVVADLDQDTKLDVAVTTSYFVMVRFGNGDGTFRAGPVVSALYGPDWIAAADLNGDTWPDLVFRREVAYQVYAVAVMLGTGNGAFGPITDFTVAGSEAIQGLSLGDLNGDHHIDAVAPTRDGALKILLGNGDGTFGPETDEETLRGRIFGRPIVLSDLNHDSRLDAIVPAYPDTVFVLLGLGNGHFGPATPFQSGSSAKEALVGDLDSDGNADVAITNTADGTVSVLRGLGDGTLGPHAEFPGGSGTLAIADFNHDQKPDLALRNSARVSILLGNGDATFGSGLEFKDIEVDASRVITADLNGDTRPDLVTTGAINIGIYLGNGDGTFVRSSVVTEPGPRGTEATALGDFNQDHHLDLAVSTGARFVRIQFGNGDGTFNAGPALEVSDDPRTLAVADVNGDSHDDVVVPVHYSNFVSVFLGNGDGTFGSRNDFGAGLDPTAVAVGDLNGDNFPDLVVANYQAWTVSVLLGDGTGSFGAHVDYPIPGEVTSLVLARLNHDATLDIAVQGYGTHVLLGNGDGTFGPAAEYPGGGDARSFAVADLNGDGSLDIATNGFGNCCVNVSEGASVLLGNGDGTFQPRQDFGGGLGSESAAIADFDGSGHPDLAVANSHSYSVSILLNTTPSNRAPDCSAASASVSSLWPPDRKFAPVSILGVTDPDGDPLTIVVTSVTQDEPLLGRGNRDDDDDEDHGDDDDDSVGGPGAIAASAAADAARAVVDPARASAGEGRVSGNRERDRGNGDCPDAVILDNGQVKLRRERLEHGNGRVYAISFTATDAAGGAGSGTVHVCVPAGEHRRTCVDDGQTVNSLGPCPRRFASRDQLGVDGLALTPRASTGSEMTLEFTIPVESDVVVAMYDVSGRRLATLANSRQAVGRHEVSWNTSGVPSGIYFVRLRAGAMSLTKTVVKLR